MENGNYFKSKSLVLVGHVQSGKTHEEINFCYESIFSRNTPVIFITRNIKADQLQLISRCMFFSKSLKTQMLSHSTIHQAKAFLESIGILILLCNSNQLRRTVEVLKEYSGEYNVCIDEIDFTIKTKKCDSPIDAYLKKIKSGASYILGATATPIALFNNNLTDSFVKLKPKAGYRGISSLSIKFVESNISKNILSDYTAIQEVYTSLLTKKSAVLLHTVSKNKEIHKELLYYLILLFPTFTVITYNGDGIRVICNSRQSKPLTKKLTSNVYGQCINRYSTTLENNTLIHNFYNWTISEVLQLLKDDPIYSHTHITIISGNLAARGISFVSSDYTIHLTDQYFKPSKNTHGENYLQSLRILGCYTDSVPLTLWCDPKTWKAINDHSEIINKIIDHVNDSTEWMCKIKEVSVIRPDSPLTRHRVNPRIHKISPGHFKMDLDFDFE